VQPEQLPSIQPDMRRTFCKRSRSATSAHLSTEIFDLSKHIPDDSQDMDHLTEAFNSRLKATEKLVSAFISICGKGTSGFQQEDLLLKYHAAQSEVRPTSSTHVNQCSVPTYLGKESSLATGNITISTLGGNHAEGAISQRSRTGPITRRSAQQQDHSSYGPLPESQRRCRPIQRV